MNIHVRRRRDTFIRMKAHRQENPGDFPAGSVPSERLTTNYTKIHVLNQTLSDVHRWVSRLQWLL